MIKNSTVNSVNLHVGRKRLGFPIDPILLGIDVQSNEMKLFLNEHVELGKFHIVPKSKEQAIVNFEMSARNKFKKMTVPLNFGTIYHYMTDNMLHAFKKEFEVMEKEYEKLLDDMLANYDQIVDNFISLFLSSVKDKKKLAFVQKMKSEIPLKEDYKDAFKITLFDMPYIIGDNKIVLYRFLGKSISVSSSLVDHIDKMISKNGKVNQRTLNRIERDVLLIAETNLTEDENIQNLIKMFWQIRELSGMGQNSKNLVKKIKLDVINLATHYQTMDMLTL